MIMWKHYCKIEETNMEVGHNEECNWCGLKEHADPVVTGDTKQLLIDENDNEGTLIQE